MSIAERNMRAGLRAIGEGRGEASKRSRSGYIITNADRRRRLGRLQRQCRRSLIALGSVRIKDLLAWCYPHALEFQPWHRTNVHRAIVRVARPVGKTRARHATTWVLRDMDATRPK